MRLRRKRAFSGTAASAAVIAIALMGAGLAARAAGAASTLCVGGPGCYSTLQAALTAAHDGDTIRIGPGTFAGGVTIGKSVSVIGSGASRTVIRGGGPVITISRQIDPAGLKVSISAVTITGGVNQIEQVNFGGGISIPAAQLPDPPYNGPGATVSISDSAITGNVVTSQSVVPPGDFCGPRPCAFDIGGGISNSGALTLVNTRVTDNTAGSAPSLPSLASGAFDGGINNGFTGSVVLKRSVVSGNHAVVAPPNGEFAANGGIGSSGPLTVEDSTISGNEVSTSSTLSGDEDFASASAGGIGVGGGSSATIRNTIVRGNRVLAKTLDPSGVSNAFAGGLDVDGQLVLERSLVTDNVVQSVSAGDAIADGGGLEVDGNATIRDTLISHNSVVLQASRAAVGVGGGVANGGQLTLQRTLVLDNSVSASGSGGEIIGFPSGVKGGGIWNGTFDGQSTATLTLDHSSVLRNSLVAPGSFVIQGGGLYTDFAVTKTVALIAANKPDQCVGC